MFFLIVGKTKYGKIGFASTDGCTYKKMSRGHKDRPFFILKVYFVTLIVELNTSAVHWLRIREKEHKETYEKNSTIAHHPSEKWPSYRVKPG